jgi:hypothetical protein
VLSHFSDGATYPGWPIRYPSPGQTGVPATAYPITVHWRYFGPAPALTTTSLTTTGGSPIAHTASTSLPVGHKGIQIAPAAALPANTAISVTVSGTYDGAPFSYAWTITTGN